MYAVRVNRIDYICNAQCETDELGIVVFASKTDAEYAFATIHPKLLGDKQSPYTYRDLCNLDSLVMIFRDHNIPCQILKIEKTVTIS